MLTVYNDASGSLDKSQGCFELDVNDVWQGLRIMAESPTVGVRIPAEWLEEINALCEETGKTKTQIMLEALAQYLGKNTVVGINADLEEIRSLLQNHDQRLEAIEKKLGL